MTSSSDLVAGVRGRRARGSKGTRLALAALVGLGVLAGAGTASTVAQAATTTTWTQVSPASSPSARDDSGGNVAYDAALGRVVLFGGYNGNTPTDPVPNDTWTWDGITWTMSHPPTSPSGRTAPAMAYDAARGRIVLFGGAPTLNSSFGCADVFSETWTFDGTTWTQAHPATSPPARCAAAMAFDATTGKVVLFGGFTGSNHGSVSLNDTWTWDGTTWSQVSPAASPPGRTDTDMAFDARTGRLVLFGGATATSILSDTWTFDGTTWAQAASAANPPARRDAAMAFDPAGGSVVLFGGVEGSGQGGDTWAFDGTTWTQLAPSASPSARSFSAMDADPRTGRLVLFGGFTGSGYLGDTWLFASSGTPKGVTRLGGADRVGTAAAISKDLFIGSGAAKAVVVARSDTFPDALAGGPYAAQLGGPLLLTGPSALDPVTKAEIQRVLPTGSTVYLLGGPGALSSGIDTALQALGYKTQRVAGADRFATAVAIAQAMGNPATIFEATGLDFPDALASGPAAAVSHGAVLLTNGGAQATATGSYLSAHSGDARFALGGPAAGADPTATPLVGADRFDTSAVVASRFFPAAPAIAVANAFSFPDALAGVPHASSNEAPLLLVAPASPLPATVSKYITDHASSLVLAFVYGGTTAVPASVVTAVQTALG